MRRREFLARVGGAVMCPRAATAQQPSKAYTIAIFSAGPRNSTPHLDATFFQALRELGWIEAGNVVFEYRYADNQTERLPELAAELVRLNVDVIVALGTLETHAAKRATTTIPIVMPVAGDPIAEGLVASLPRPGGNITGMSYMSPELAPKRLQLLKEVLPALSRVAILWNPTIPTSARVMRETEEAARTLGTEVLPVEARNASELDSAYSLVALQRPDALIVVQDFLTLSHRGQIADFAIRNGLPSVHSGREFALAGGLMSYGPDLADLIRRAAGHVDKILKGAKPADLPVEQPTKFEFVVNLRTARALGLIIPPTLLTTANEVIE
jgi:putative ABC transport system substrate-binding protein